MAEHWRQRPEGGGRVALWLIFNITRFAGRPLARLLMYPIALYFYLRRGPERRAAREFLARVCGRPARTWQVLAQFDRFATTYMDRVFLLGRGERDFAITVDGLSALEDELARDRGVLLMGAHMGSFEVLRTLAARRPDARLRIVLNTQQTPVMTGLMETLAPEVAANIIDGAGEPGQVVLAISQSLAQGQMVALLADRGRPGEVMKGKRFLGASAPFPIGPWRLALALKVPVMLCLGLYEGGNRYRLVFEPLADTGAIERAEREAALDALLTNYVARLEHYARRWPGNWFNFYDFWDEAAVDDEAAGGGRGL